MDKAELRQVLEAVERGEISPEDAEKLIEAMYSKENEEKSKEEEFVEVTEEIEETKEIHRNISMTNGKLILKGKVNGNVSVVNSIIEIKVL